MYFFIDKISFITPLSVLFIPPLFVLHYYLFFVEPSHHYVFEYAKEFGLLRLSQKARNRFKIPVKVISLGKCYLDPCANFNQANFYRFKVSMSKN